MEKNSLSNSLKDHSCNNNNNNKKKQIKYSWNYNNNNNNQSVGEDYLSGFSWPPRSYTCSFCKREFRSAQALGGHMNVHRRDRARLRQSPPRDGQCTILNLNINPNPNKPTLSSSSSPFTCTLPSSAPPTLSALSSPSFASSSETKKWVVDDSTFHDPLSPKSSDLITKTRTRKSFLDAEEFDGLTKEDGCKFLKKAEILRLDLEIGLLTDPKEELDLELRLGYS